MDQEFVNRVEDFIGGRLSEREANDFQRELVENSELAEVYRQYKLAMETVDTQEGKLLKKKFASWQKPHETKTREIISFPLIWKVAASFILVLGFYYVYIQSSQEFDTYAELAESRYVLPESYGRSMGSNEVLWQQGLDAYETNDFEEAVINWSSIEQPSEEVQYFLAHAYFNTGAYERAASLFSQLSQNNDTYSFSSDWYLLLTYLMMEKLDLFDDQCEKILHISNHTYINEAHELRKEVRKIQK